MKSPAPEKTLSQRTVDAAAVSEPCGLNAGSCCFQLADPSPAKEFGISQADVQLIVSWFEAMISVGEAGDRIAAAIREFYVSVGHGNAQESGIKRR
jgi:hypothetical protein